MKYKPTRCIKQVGLVLIIFILLISFYLYNLTNSLERNRQYATNNQGSPLPSNYFYDKCIQDGARWNCPDKINSADCCICKDINETFYFNIGCSSLSPEELCFSSGGNWSSLEGRNENSKSCICQSGTTYVGGKCKAI